MGSECKERIARLTFVFGHAAVDERAEEGGGGAAGEEGKGDGTHQEGRTRVACHGQAYTVCAFLRELCAAS